MKKAVHELKLTISNVLQQFGSALLLTILFSVAFAVKRLWFPSEIIFYEGIFCAFAFIVLVALMNLTCRFVRRDSLLPALLMMLMFTSLIPTILDRSVSIAVLTAINECGKTCDTKSLTEMFYDSYILSGEQ